MPNTYLYVQQIEGGIGLLGISGSPTLLGSIQVQPGSFFDLTGLIYANTLISGSTSLNGSIFGSLDLESSSISGVIFGRVMHSDQTDSTPLIYVSLPGGGIGLFGGTTVPDLKGTVFGAKAVSSGDLIGSIVGTSTGTGDLNGYIIPSTSGDLDLSGTISIFHEVLLSGYVRGTVSGDLGLPTEIEAIPPVDLSGILFSYPFNDCIGEIEAVEPSELSGMVSGVPRLDLLGTIAGVDSNYIEGIISGYKDLKLYGIITARNSGYLDLFGNIQGRLGSDINRLSGYIIPATPSSLDLNSYVDGVLFQTLSGIIQPYHTVDLGVSILGDMPGGLSGSITPTGLLLDLSGYLFSSTQSTNNINSSIDGTAVSDLQGIISNTDPILLGIIASNDKAAEIFGHINGILETDISGTYTPNLQALLSGNIFAIEPTNLGGLITPKVFYIESSIPINTYPFSELKASINGDFCGYSSSFSELGVIINGIEKKDLSAYILGLAGQYVLCADEISLLIKHKVSTADWVFFIANPPSIASDYLTLILTNSPLGDLGGYIYGEHNNTSLSGTIQPKYISSVNRDGFEIGEWVNTKTGERRLIKIKFKGTAQNFYYSSDGNISYPLNSFDNLEILVETYTLEGSSNNSLLAVKRFTRKHIIGNLADFDSIDSAIRYAIVVAAGELNTELSGFIEGIGLENSLEGTISGLDYRYMRDLQGNIMSVEAQPILSGSITSTGSVLDMSGHISPTLTQSTYNNFIDSSGLLYKPVLALHGNNEYSVVLTQVLSSGTLNISSSPDLKAMVNGVVIKDLESNISGTL